MPDKCVLSVRVCGCSVLLLLHRVLHSWGMLCAGPALPCRTVGCSCLSVSEFTPWELCFSGSCVLVAAAGTARGWRPHVHA